MTGEENLTNAMMGIIRQMAMQWYPEEATQDSFENLIETSRVILLKEIERRMHDEKHT